MDQAFLGTETASELNSGRKPGRFVKDRESLSYLGGVTLRTVCSRFHINADLTDSDLRFIFKGADFKDSAEALIGAVTIDCTGDLETIGRVVGFMLLSTWGSFIPSGVDTGMNCSA